MHENVSITAGLFDPDVITVRVDGDAYPRFAVDADGTIRTGDGQSAPTPFEGGGGGGGSADTVTYQEATVAATPAEIVCDEPSAEFPIELGDPPPVGASGAVFVGRYAVIEGETRVVYAHSATPSFDNYTINSLEDYADTVTAWLTTHFGGGVVVTVEDGRLVARTSPLSVPYGPYGEASGISTGPTTWPAEVGGTGSRHGLIFMATDLVAQSLGVPAFDPEAEIVFGTDASYSNVEEALDATTDAIEALGAQVDLVACNDAKQNTKLSIHDARITEAESDIEQLEGDVAELQEELATLEADDVAFDIEVDVPASAATVSAAVATDTDFSEAPVTFNLTVDETTVSITLDADYTDAEGVAAAINAQFGANVATVEGGVLTITSPTEGAASFVKIANYTEDGLATTGLADATANGTDAVPSIPPLTPGTVKSAIVQVAVAATDAATAAGTSYDNTESGLAATNVKEAIDEVVSRIGGPVPFEATLVEGGTTRTATFTSDPVDLGDPGAHVAAVLIDTAAITTVPATYGEIVATPNLPVVIEEGVNDELHFDGTGATVVTIAAGTYETIADLVDAISAAILVAIPMMGPTAHVVDETSWKLRASYPGSTSFVASFASGSAHLAVGFPPGDTGFVYGTDAGGTVIQIQTSADGITWANTGTPFGTSWQPVGVGKAWQLVAALEFLRAQVTIVPGADIDTEITVRGV